MISLPRRPIGLGSGLRLGRMPTGVKILIILSVALLPLAIIAVVATLSTTRQSEQEAQARLRVATAESAHALSIQLAGDMTALAAVTEALAADRANAASCARAEGVFAGQASVGVRFAIVDRAGKLLCGVVLPVALPARGTTPIAARFEADRGLVLAVTDGRGDRGIAFYPAGLLADTAKPSAFAVDYRASLVAADGSVLPLRRGEDAGTLDAYRSQEVALGLGDLGLQLSTHAALLSSPVLIAMMLPVLMWAAAAGIAWFVVDGLLIRPLRSLRASVAAYRPGEEIDPAMIGALPAAELRDLGDTFRTISRTLMLHEEGLAEGLRRQTRLTREVHHRVKNNLQVISSLISLHARSAVSPEATRAYASIQRRVDALAVVHRHHFAELEETRGLMLRSVIGELASNVRATAPEEASHLGITLDIAPFYVSQDVAIAIAFLLTELIELAMACNPATQIRISVRPDEDRATLAIMRVSSPALIDCDALRETLSNRYARVMEGLARQLRERLHHDPLTGAYEIPVPVTSRD